MYIEPGRENACKLEWVWVLRIHNQVVCGALGTHYKYTQMNEMRIRYGWMSLYFLSKVLSVLRSSKFFGTWSFSLSSLFT